MRSLFWALVALGLTGLAYWIVLGPWLPKNQIEMALTVVLFTLPTPGAIWMIRIAVRSEKNSLPMVLLAFFPYAFLWYYFERVRPRKHTTQERTA
jgi:uncharacterized membrane protein YqjE